MSPQQVQQRLQSGEIHLIDVREKPEWDERHIEGARLFPLSRLELMAAALPTNKPLVLYCRSGARSAQALILLKRLGLPAEAHMAGGIGAWAAAGLPFASF